jgi:hypothetical protein
VPLLWNIADSVVNDMQLLRSSHAFAEGETPFVLTDANDRVGPSRRDALSGRKHHTAGG